MASVDLNAFTALISMLVIFIASVISSVTGMAGGVLMFSALNLFIPLRPLVAIHGVIQLFSNAMRSWLLRADIRWAMCIPFFLGATLGALMATFLLIHFFKEWALLLVLNLLILYTLFRSKRLPALQIANRHFFWVGIATGIMGILVGVIDPLLGAFFIRDDLRKEQVVATKSVMQLFVHATKVPAFIFLGFSFIDHFLLLFVFVLVALAGTKVGVFLLSRTNQKLFFLTMKIALFIAAVRISYQLITTMTY